MSKKNKSSNTRFIIFGAVMVLYAILFFIDQNKTMESLTYGLKIFMDIIPIFGIIYIFMVIFNFIPEKKLKSYMQKTSGFFQYFVLSLLGTISHGPIYAWYPLLKDLKNRGLSDGSIGAYLFSKGIKLTLLPLMIHYFGFKLTIIFSVTLFILSFLQAFLIDLFMRKNTPVD